MAWKEVNDIVKEFVISLDANTPETDPHNEGFIPTCDSGFWCVVRDYDWARDNLRKEVLTWGEGEFDTLKFDTLEDLAEYVLLKYAEVAARLIKWTPLRQEDDLRLAVDILIEQGAEQSRRVDQERYDRLEEEQERLYARYEDRKRARAHNRELGLYL